MGNVDVGHPNEDESMKIDECLISSRETEKTGFGLESLAADTPVELVNGDMDIANDNDDEWTEVER